MVLNNLYAQTQLQSVFGINMVALVDGQPKILNLKEILEAFIRHRREVVTRRTVFLLRKARERGHILEGLAIALANIDPVIELIKASPSAAEAREKLLAQRPGRPGTSPACWSVPVQMPAARKTWSRSTACTMVTTICRRPRPRRSSTCACTV